MRFGLRLLRKEIAPEGKSMFVEEDSMVAVEEDWRTVPGEDSWTVGGKSASTALHTEGTSAGFSTRSGLPEPEEPFLSWDEGSMLPSIIILCYSICPLR